MAKIQSLNSKILNKINMLKNYRWNVKAVHSSDWLPGDFKKQAQTYNLQQ